jgi:hypothetical protein
MFILLIHQVHGQRRKRLLRNTLQSKLAAHYSSSIHSLRLKVSSLLDSVLQQTLTPR